MQVFGRLELSSNSFRTKVFVVFLDMCRYQATDVAGSWTNEDRHFIDVHRSSVIFRPPRTKPISIRRVMVLWPQDSINISVLPSQLKKNFVRFFVGSFKTRLSKPRPSCLIGTLAIHEINVVFVPQGYKCSCCTTFYWSTLPGWAPVTAGRVG